MFKLFAISNIFVKYLPYNRKSSNRGANFQLTVKILSFHFLNVKHSIYLILIINFIGVGSVTEARLVFVL